MVPVGTPSAALRRRPSPSRRPHPCAECHLYNGHGFLGAADLSGLTASYIVEQVRAFRSGTRRSAQATRPDTAEMIAVAKTVSDADLAQAAGYFAALPRRPRVRVVETADVPVTRPDKYGWLDLIPNGGREAIGARVIEVSADMDSLLLGDDRVAIIDYAPPGAIRRGETLASSGGAGRQPCASCHGSDLRGLGDTPPLAGRPAAYLARMLWDIKSGARGGLAVGPMQAPARGLSERDIVDITAYLASSTP